MILRQPFYRRRHEKVQLCCGFYRLHILSYINRLLRITLLISFYIGTKNPFLSVQIYYKFYIDLEQQLKFQF